jgi:hypothetical protein
VSGPAGRHAVARRLGELAATARNAARLAAGARLVDGQALESLDVEAEICLDDARARFAVPPAWTVRNRLPTVADVAVLELAAGPELTAVLKLARTAAGNESLLLQLETLQRLAAEAGLRPWRRLLPEVIAHGDAGTSRYAIERAVPGTIGSALPRSSASSRNAVLAIAGLHRGSGAAALPSGADVAGWLQPGLSMLAELPMLLGPARRRRLVDGLRNRIRSGTEGRTVWLSRTHGDYFPGNVFFSPSADVTGIIDWGQSRENDPAMIDVATYLLVVRAARQGEGLGTVVRDLCRGGTLDDDDGALVELHRSSCPADRLDGDVLALLAWLRHVENNLLKSPRYGADPAWVYLTVERVLKSVAG